MANGESADGWKKSRRGSDASVPDYLTFLPSYDPKDGDAGRVLELVEVPEKAGFVASWDADAQGKKRVGFYFSKGESNPGLGNFKDVWAPFAGIDVSLNEGDSRGFPQLGTLRKWKIPGEKNCQTGEDTRPLWRKKWDVLADSDPCVTTGTDYAYQEGLGALGRSYLENRHTHEYADLNEPEALKVFQAIRRSKWADKFGTYWQLAQSAVCGTARIPPELVTVMFPGGNVERMWDPSFDMIPYLVQRWRWSETNKNFVKRKPDERLPDCPFPIVYGNRRDLGRCAFSPGLRFQRGDDDSEPAKERDAFEKYREALTVNDWLRRHGALAVQRSSERANLHETVRDMINPETMGHSDGERVVRVLRQGPTRRAEPLLGRLRPRPVNTQPRDAQPPVPRETPQPRDAQPPIPRDTPPNYPPPPIPIVNPSG